MASFNLTQSWVGYLQRSYQQIKANLISKLPPEVTDHSESNILIIILSMFAGIAEMINLYIDRMAEEAFIGTARRYSSMVKLARQLDYRVKAAICSTGEITISVVNTTTGALVNAVAPITIPAGTIFLSPNGLPYVLDSAVIILIGQSQAIGQVTQYSQETNLNLGSTTGIASEKFNLGKSYVHKSLTLTILGDTYTEVDSFGLSNSTAKIFIVEVDEEQDAWLTFGDGVNGVIPPVGAVLATFKNTYGEIGNLPPGSIAQWAGAIPSTGIPSTVLKVTNPNYTVNGKGYEDIEDIRANAPRSLRTLLRAVTYQDYTDIAKLAPGVGSATVRYCCGECVRVYIGPSTRGIAPSNLIVSTTDFFNCKKMLGRCLTVLPAGLTRIYLKVTVNCEYGVSTMDAQDKFADTMENNFGYANSYPNKATYISDVIAAIDNTDGIRNLNLQEIWAEPYARPLTNNNPLTWVPVIKSGSIIKTQWKLVYNTAAAGFRVYKGGLLIGTAYPNTLWGDPMNILEFTIGSGIYVDGQTFEFTTYPINQDIILDDNSIPIVDVIFTTSPATGFYTLNLVKDNVTSTCNPTC